MSHYSRLKESVSSFCSCKRTRRSHRTLQPALNTHTDFMCSLLGRKKTRLQSCSHLLHLYNSIHVKHWHWPPSTDGGLLPRIYGSLERTNSPEHKDQAQPRQGGDRGHSHIIEKKIKRHSIPFNECHWLRSCQGHAGMSFMEDNVP